MLKRSLRASGVLVITFAIAASVAPIAAAKPTPLANWWHTNRKPVIELHSSITTLVSDLAHLAKALNESTKKFDDALLAFGRAFKTVTTRVEVARRLRPPPGFKEWRTLLAGSQHLALVASSFAIDGKGFTGLESAATRAGRLWQVLGGYLARHHLNI